MARDKIKQLNPDVLTLDVEMPRMDGLTFLEKAESINHGATVIMMSAFGSVDTALEAMKQGAYDYITKPFVSEEVMARVTVNVARKKAEEKFKEAKEAHEVLSDANKRAAYDQYGHAGVDPSMGGRPGAGAGGFEDIFGDVFGDIFGGGGGRGRGPQRGADLRYNLDLSLEDAEPRPPEAFLIKV